jgi:hypothetical protein
MSSNPKNIKTLDVKEITLKLEHGLEALLYNERSSFYEKDLYLDVLQNAIIKVLTNPNYISDKVYKSITEDIGKEDTEMLIEDLSSAVKRAGKKAIKITFESDVKMEK